jgi:alpha-tubulin suppressor-like RCC1 family protein
MEKIGLRYFAGVSLILAVSLAGIPLGGHAAQEVVAWGRNSTGQTIVPDDLSNVVAIAAGGDHTLALTAAGRVVAWGDNTYGQTNVPSGLSNVAAIAAGQTHDLALTVEGRVVAWGSNQFGQTNVPGGLSNVIAIAAGSSHSLALTAGGEVVGWGLNDHGETVAPGGLGNVVAIAAAGIYSLALTADGRVVAWGDDYFGPKNALSGLSNVVAIAAGDEISLALDDGGEVLAWGKYYDHSTYVPCAVPNGLSNVVAVAAAITTGYQYRLALTVEGRVVAWGNNWFGQTNVPGELSNVVAIAAGNGHSLALRGSPPGVAAPAHLGPHFLMAVVDHPFCHRIMVKNGATVYGATNLPSGLVLDRNTGVITGQPAQAGKYQVEFSATNSVGSDAWTVTLIVNDPAVPGIPNQELVLTRVGAAFSYPVVAYNEPGRYGARGLPAGWVIDAQAGVISGVPTAYGNYPVSLVASNRYGEGKGSLSITVSPLEGWSSLGQERIPSGLTDAVAIAAGTSHYLALTAEGQVKAWGYGNYGQMDVPSGLSNVVGIAAGDNHSLALTAEGRVVGWGMYSFGAGPLLNTVPEGLSNVVAIAAAGSHSLALTADGGVVGWGYDPTNSTYVPYTVPRGLSNVVAIAAGAGLSLALTAEGRVVQWPAETNLPRALTNVVGIAAGWSYGLALTAEGQIVAWGDNYYGQLNVPSELSNVLEIAAGSWHGLALTAEGQVVAWGKYNDGSTFHPCTVPDGLRNVGAIAAGGSHSLTLSGMTPGADAPAWVGPRRLVGTAYRPFYHRIRLRNGANTYGATGLPGGLVLDRNTGLITGQPTQPGTHPVVLSATNNAGSCEWTVTLFVNGTGAPSILLEPASQTVMAQTNVTFQVRAMGKSLSYQWLFNGTPIPGETNASLTLTKVMPAQSGQYAVTVSNELAALTSPAASLTVVRPNPSEQELRAALQAGGLVKWEQEGTVLLKDTIPIAKDTVLDATGHAVVISGQNQVRVFTVSSQVHLTLINITVANGYGDQGGGLYNEGGTVSLSNCIFTDNQAFGVFPRDKETPAARGGAIYSIGGEIAATNCLFARNTAVPVRIGSGTVVLEARGGALGIQDGLLALVNCQFATNQASGGIQFLDPRPTKGRAFGGAMCVMNSAGQVSGCRFDHNLAQSPLVFSEGLDIGADVQGGAIHYEGGGLLELRDCAFVENQALGGGGGLEGRAGDGRGGAVSAYGNLMAHQSLFLSNACYGGEHGASKAGNAFGGALFTTTKATLNQCLYAANWASAGTGSRRAGNFGTNGNANGGAVYAQGTLQILNTSFAANWVEGQNISYDWLSPWPGNCAGGAVFSSAVCVATNSTWFQNRAPAQRLLDGPAYIEGTVAGAAIYQSGNPLTLVHCTIASNEVVSMANNAGGAIASVADAVARVSACVLAGNTNGNLAGSILDEGFNLSSDHSVVLAASGSRNDVDPKLGEFGDHGGATPTLALLPDSPAIDAVTSGTSPDTDQRGVPRPIGPRCDIGAFEFIPDPVLAWDATGAFHVERVLQPLRDYQIDSSADLLNWSLFSATRSDDRGKLGFSDSTVNQVPFRFYRATPK